ncbi:MAG: hypothetical protein HFE64_07440 [Lachnospiraceae bacterium]|jgi:hypothetical protein|nr:hypothetical protein [Lachnospiraceae bacterium]
MKYKHMILAGLFLSFCLLSSCQLALEESEGDGQGHLIGLFITQEHFEMNAPEEQRIYAKRENERWDFDGIEGICCFVPDVKEEEEHYTEICMDEAIYADRSEIKTTDEGNEVRLEATLYFPPCGKKLVYLNPVYQDERGRVYAVQGNGLDMDFDGPGVSCSHRLEENQAKTENGKREAEIFSAQLTLESRALPEEVRLIEMTADHQKTQETVYAAGEVPAQLVLPEEVAYVVMETKEEQEIERAVVSRGEEGLESWYLREDGYLAARYTQLLWQE